MKQGIEIISTSWTLEEIREYTHQHTALKLSGHTIEASVWWEGLDEYGSDVLSSRMVSRAGNMVRDALGGVSKPIAIHEDEQTLAYSVVPIDPMGTRYGIVLLYGWNCYDPTEWEIQ